MADKKTKFTDEELQELSTKVTELEAQVSGSS